MADFNICILAGRLTDEPETRYTTSGTACTEFSIAVNRKSGERQETLFIGCVTWGKLAENVGRYLTKGAGVLVRGSLRQESWTTRDGAKRSTIKLICDEVQFTDRRPAANDAPPPPPPAPAPAPGGHKFPKSDIPPTMYQRPPATPPIPPDPHIENIENVNTDDIPF